MPNVDLVNCDWYDCDMCMFKLTRSPHKGLRLWSNGWRFLLTNWILFMKKMLEDVWIWSSLASLMACVSMALMGQITYLLGTPNALKIGGILCLTSLSSCCQMMDVWLFGAMLSCHGCKGRLLAFHMEIKDVSLSFFLSTFSKFILWLTICCNLVLFQVMSQPSPTSWFLGNQNTHLISLTWHRTLNPPWMSNTWMSSSRT